MTEPIVALLVSILGVFAFWALFRPVKGLFWRWQRAFRYTERMLIEDAVLMPLIRIQPYAMLPEQLRGTGLIGTDRIDFSRSWQPQETPETP